MILVAKEKRKVAVTDAFTFEVPTSKKIIMPSNFLLALLQIKFV